jgi:hypothetical protein
MPNTRDALPDGLADKLVRDPADVPDLRALVGYLGRSSRPRHIRLYLTPDLGEYVEIPEDAVVHKQPLASEERPLAGSAVWVKRAAELIRVRSQSREAQADFLKGAISTHLRTPPGRHFHPAQLQYIRHRFFMSSVPEFCEFTILSFAGGGSVYCTEDYACGVTSAAEC